MKVRLIKSNLEERNVMFTLMIYKLEIFKNMNLKFYHANIMLVADQYFQDVYHKIKFSVTKQ